MSTMTTCKVLKDSNGAPTGVIVTPRVKMLYANIFEKSLPKGETDKEKANYNIMVLVHKATDIKPLADLVSSVGEGKHGKGVKIKKPFKKITEDDEPALWSRLQEAGLDPKDWPLYFRASTKMGLTVVGPNMQKIADDAEAYDGRWCRLSVKPWPYDHPTGGKGVSIGLENVQLLDHDEVIPRKGGSTPEQAFEAVDSGGGETTSADGLFD